MSKKLLFLCLLISIVFRFSTIQAQAKENVVIPEDIQELCIQYGEEYEICPTILMSMCWHESRCRAEITSLSGTYKGLTQINPRYFKASMELLEIDDLLDAEQNIKLCAYTLNQYRQDYDDVYAVLMCWNSGSTKAKRLVKQGIVTSYAKKVAKTSELLQERMETDGHY